jgi:hypothetical protein
MTNEKVNEVLASHIKRLQDVGYYPKRYEHPPSRISLPGQGDARKHVLWMAQEALAFPAEKLEKKMRWLGFIQGIAWYVDGIPIQTLKEQNMPDEEKTDA